MIKNYKEQFKGKKITVMGLGLLGRGIGYTKFLAECGADLIVTDLKTSEQLATSLKALEQFPNIKFVLGEHRLEDFRNRDMIMKAAGVPYDSIYIEEAKKNNIPIEMDVSLFVKSAPGVMTIAVTGTRGKSMTTTLIYEILRGNEDYLKRKVYLGGNSRGVATLPLLKKVKDGDILVCELDSWQLQGFGDAKISPHISVFTTFMPDHMNYYRGSMEKYFNDKAKIFVNQKKGDVLIILSKMKKFISSKNVPGKLFVATGKTILDWKFNVPGEHQRDNLSCAVKVAEILGIPESKVKKSVAKFKDLEGRLQLLKVYNGVKIYNDNNATTPEATIAGIEAMKTLIKDKSSKKIILICGGADKKLNLTTFVKAVNNNCKYVSLIPGTGTDVLLKEYKLKVNYNVGKDLNEVVQTALKISSRGDIVLFSPAFASFGMFNNEYERNDLFMKIINKLK